jgi:hypothetical protein
MFYVLYSWFGPPRIVERDSPPERAADPHYCYTGPFLTADEAKATMGAHGEAPE